MSAEAPPGLGFRSVPEAAGLLDRLQRVAGGSKRRRQRERSEGGRWHSPLAALPPALCRKAGERCFGGLGRRKVLALNPRPYAEGDCG